MDRTSVNRRPGKLWAFLQNPLTRIVIAFGAIVLFAGPLLAGASSAHLHGLLGAGVHLLSALGAWVIYLVYVHYLEGRKPDELALRDLLPQFSKGFAIGAGIFCTSVGILWLSGVYSVSGINTTNLVFAAFINSLGAALLEEIAFRGVLFRIMEGSLGTWIALVVTAVLFGLLHGVNQGATWQDLAGIALEAGLLLAAAYVYARQLWICIGLHCAWNFADGGIFGASGQLHSLFSAKIQGPELLTGGKAGLDASVVAVLVCLAVTVTFLLLARRRGHIMAPFWRKT